MSEETIYICAICFATRESEGYCHDHRMVKCMVGELGDERRKPAMEGPIIKSRAPRWFLEAVGWLTPGRTSP